MTISMIPSLQNSCNLSETHPDNHSLYCTLQWRRGQLLVKSLRQVRQLYLPALNDEKSLVECLKHSPINLVCIDPKLGENRLNFWATACEKADKPIFLRIPSGNKLSKKRNLILWCFNRIFDWISALLLLLIFSPVMLGLILLLRIYSPESIFSHDWHVGERGRLFRAIKFGNKNNTLLENWIYKYGLHNLPLLLNVLRGDIKLIGSHCWTLEDAVRLSLAEQQKLNELPGITSSWQIDSESSLFNLDGQAM